MMPQIEVTVDGEIYNCSVNSDHFRINQQNFQVSAFEIIENLVKLEIDQQSVSIYCIDNEHETAVICQGFSFSVRSNLILNQALVIRKNTGKGKIFQNLICADLFGKVLKLNVHEGDVVQSGQIMLTLESMKTEIHVLCPVNARVKKIYVEEGNAVIEKQLLLELQPPPTPPKGERKGNVVEEND
jgi:biotin carboxyl carrier protein